MPDTYHRTHEEVINHSIFLYEIIKKCVKQRFLIWEECLYIYETKNEEEEERRV